MTTTKDLNECWGEQSSTREEAQSQIDSEARW